MGWKVEGTKENKFPVAVHGFSVGRLSMLSCALKQDPGYQTFLSHLAPSPGVTPRFSRDSSSGSRFSWPCKPYQTHTALNTHVREVKDQGALTSSWRSKQRFPTAALPRHRTSQAPVEELPGQQWLLCFFPLLGLLGTQQQPQQHHFAVSLFVEQPWQWTAIRPQKGHAWPFLRQKAQEEGWRFLQGQHCTLSVEKLATKGMLTIKPCHYFLDADFLNAFLSNTANSPAPRQSLQWGFSLWHSLKNKV